MKKSGKNNSPKNPISRSLRETIIKRGLTAYATAKKAGVSVDAVRRFIKDQRGLTLDTADKIAESLDLTLCESDLKLCEDVKPEESFH